MIDFYGLFSVNAAICIYGNGGSNVDFANHSNYIYMQNFIDERKYKEFMGGSDGTSIEELIKGNLEDVNQIKKLYSIENENNIKDIYEKLEYTFQKLAV